MTSSSVCSIATNSPRPTGGGAHPKTPDQYCLIWIGYLSPPTHLGRPCRENNPQPKGLETASATADGGISEFQNRKISQAANNGVCYFKLQMSSPQPKLKTPWNAYQERIFRCWRISMSIWIFMGRPRGIIFGLCLLLFSIASGGAADSAVRVDVDFDGIVRTLDANMFGVNTAIWDATLDTPDSIACLREAAPLALRFPGGSISDQYHWASNTSVSARWQWPTSFKHFMHVATNLQAQVVITVNYGSGTPRRPRPGSVAPMSPTIAISNFGKLAAKTMAFGNMTTMSRRMTRSPMPAAPAITSPR